MSSNNAAFDFNKILSGIQESGARMIHGMGAIPPPVSLNEAWQSAMLRLRDEPTKLAALQKRFVEEQQRLMLAFAQPEGAEHAVPASLQDKRFSSAAWQSAPQYRYLAESPGGRYIGACCWRAS